MVWTHPRVTSLAAGACRRPAQVSVLVPSLLLGGLVSALLVQVNDVAVGVVGRGLETARGSQRVGRVGCKRLLRLQ